MLIGACNADWCLQSDNVSDSVGRPALAVLPRLQQPEHPRCAHRHGDLPWGGARYCWLGLDCIPFLPYFSAPTPRCGALLSVHADWCLAIQFFFFKWHAPFPFSGFDRPRNKKDSLRRTLAWFLAFLPPNNAAAAAAASEDGKLDAAAPTA